MTLYVVYINFVDASICGRDELVSDICSQIKSHVCINSSTSIVIGGYFSCELKDGILCCQNVTMDNDLYVSVIVNSLVM